MAGMMGDTERHNSHIMYIIAHLICNYGPSGAVIQCFFANKVFPLLNQYEPFSAIPPPI